MQAIETEYKGPTDTRGSRIIARAQAGRISVPWDYALSSEENHDAAMCAFVEKWGWHGSWVRGARADGKGNVYVCAKHETRVVVAPNESPYTAKKGDTVRLATGGSMTGIVSRVDARRALPVIVEWANGSHGPTSHKSLRKVTP